VTAVVFVSSTQSDEDIFKFKGQYSMEYNVIDVRMDDEFKTCPSCGYKDGFHSMFKKEENVTKWLFICPSCHDVFDIGYTV
jgi:hypothetical protein